MGKKNLDQLFQEKFKDFSEVPDDKVWGHISASLDAKNKKRRVIPFWLKLGGIAALLAVAIYLIDPFDKTEDSLPKVTDIEQQQEIDPINEDQRSALPTGVETEAEEVVADIESDENEGDGTPGKKKDQINSPIDFKRSKKVSPQNIAVSESRNSKAVQNDVDVNLAKKDNAVPQSFDTVLEDGTKSAVASQNSTDKGELAKKLNDADNEDPKRDLENNFIQANKEDITKVAEETSNELIETTEKKSIFDEIEEQEAEDQAAIKDEGDKWSVGANVAPVYFNSIGEGSPIHSSFVANSKSGDVNLSYGLTVAYALSERLSIRSGINRVDYGYDTNEVEFSPSLTASNSLILTGDGQFDNIDYATNSESLVVESMEGFNAPTKDAAPELAGKSAARTGVMGQQFGYLEVPVELNYALVDNRFGVNLVGGFSSLFLIDNSVTISSGELTTEIGEANNLNSMNFSGNIGFGVNYKFTPKIQLNIEPVFKYQLNTFSNTAGEFQPFSVGVYSGLNFRF